MLVVIDSDDDDKKTNGTGSGSGIGRRRERTGSEEEKVSQLDRFGTAVEEGKRKGEEARRHGIGSTARLKAVERKKNKR